MTNPCKDCKERTAGCHTRCPDGIEADKRDRERREKIRREKELDQGWTGYKRDMVDKRVRR